MSDGLKLIAASIAAASPGVLIEINPEVFTESERPIYDFVRTHLRQHDSLPQLTTVSEEMGIRLPRATEPITFYREQVYDRHEYGLIHAQWGGMRAAMAERDMPRIREITQAMTAATRFGQRQGREIVNVHDAMHHAMDRLRATMGTGGITGITTGWPTYDLTTGGYQNADLITIVGRPGTGKTYVLLKQAWHAYLEGANVLFVTTEMGSDKIANRLISIGMGINPFNLKTGMVSTHTMRRIATFTQDIQHAERFNIFSVGLKSSVSSVDAYIQEYMPDIIYIDGFYLLRSTLAPKNASRTEQVASVVDEVKGMTLEYERPVVISSQFNRVAGKGGKDGSLETVGFTDALGTHSSIVTALKFGPTEDPMKSRNLEFLKGREGESGEIAINFKFAPLNMDEMTEEELGAAQDASDDGEGAATRTSNTEWMM